MREKLTLKERYKFIKKIGRSYHKARKKEKGKILNIACQVAGLHRKRLIFLLNKKRLFLSKFSSKGRAIISLYKQDGKLLKILINFWHLADFSCGRLLKTQIKTLLPFYEREYGGIEEDTKLKLLSVSPATIDRLLKDEKKKEDYRRLTGRRYQKRNKDKLIENLIPIKTHLEWDFQIEKPGKLQVDLVSHDGGNLRGDFIQSLNMVDFKTGWEIVRACLNKAASNVFPQIKIALSLFPFKVLEIHPDSGAEFINAHLFRFCQENNISFTRSRPYKKDDNFWVENRNDKTVRRNVGYRRYQGKIDFLLLNLFYEKLYLYTNFFKPQRRCLKKIREGAKRKKLYDQPETPYQRVLQENLVTKKQKEKLRSIYKSLNPIILRKEIIKLQNLLLEDDKIKREFVEKNNINQ